MKLLLWGWAIASSSLLLPTAHSFAPPFRRSARKVANVIQATAAGATAFWERQWYAIAVPDQLERTTTHKRYLLGKNVVLWYDGKNDNWSALDDMCPHRGVPLSEGRVEEDGTLLCAYHAWRFDGDGKCVHIPQSPPQQQAEHCASPKACARVYPTLERHGILFIWGDSRPQAQTESKQQEPPLATALNAGAARQVALSSRMVAHSYDILMENLLCPTHVVVSHHNIVGNRYVDPKPTEMVPQALNEWQSANGGFTYSPVPPVLPNAVSTLVKFHPPAYIEIESTYENEAKSLLCLYGTPSRVGETNLVSYTVAVNGKDGLSPNTTRNPKFVDDIILKLPIWIQHVLGTLFLHQDMVLLNGQEHNFRARGLMTASQALETYFSPNQQDKMVIAFRKWLQLNAGDGVAWAKGAPQHLLHGDDVFDVYHAHTKSCKVCQGALKNIGRLQTTTLAAGVLCLLGACRGNVLIWGGVAGVSFAANAFLKKFAQIFYVYKFSHQNNP